MGWTISNNFLAKLNMSLVPVCQSLPPFIHVCPPPSTLGKPDAPQTGHQFHIQGGPIFSVLYRYIPCSLLFSHCIFVQDVLPHIQILFSFQDQIECFYSTKIFPDIYNISILRTLQAFIYIEVFISCFDCFGASHFLTIWVQRPFLIHLHIYSRT